MESGGDLLLDDVIALDSIHIILFSGKHGWQQLGRVPTSEGLFRDLQDFPDQGGGRLYAVYRLPEEQQVRVRSCSVYHQIMSQ